ncbi:MAG: hypothetical protein JWN93_3778 [Hyphomicrobiales bacterium]|jgi:hypothetical protein|nr:hypothetical protein [Hyphomicrobiales bacterium]
MNRRAFLGSLLAIGAVGVAAASQPAQAATLLDELNALEAGQPSADLPAEGAAPAQYSRHRRYGYRPRRPAYRRAYYRPVYRRPVYRRRVVCRTFVDRFGRLRRRCF